MKTTNGYFTLRPLTGTLHEDQYTFFYHISFILRMRNASDKSYKQKPKNTFCVQ